MGGSKKSKTPDPAPLIEPLKNADENMQVAREDTRRRAARLAGLAATNTTGGTLSPAFTSQKTLLGQ